MIRRLRWALAAVTIALLAAGCSSSSTIEAGLETVDGLDDVAPTPAAAAELPETDVPETDVRADPTPIADEPTAAPAAPEPAPTPAEEPAALGPPASGGAWPSGDRCTFDVGTDELLNIRSAPSLDADVVDQVQGGSCGLLPTGATEADGEWIEITWPPDSTSAAWVSGRFTGERPASSVLSVNAVAGVALGTPLGFGIDRLTDALGPPDSKESYGECGDPTLPVESFTWDNLTVDFRLPFDDPNAGLQLATAVLREPGTFTAGVALGPGVRFGDTSIEMSSVALQGFDPGGSTMWRSHSFDASDAPGYLGFFDTPNDITDASIVQSVFIGSPILDC